MKYNWSYRQENAQLRKGFSEMIRSHFHEQLVQWTWPSTHRRPVCNTGWKVSLSGHVSTATNYTSSATLTLASNASTKRSIAILPYWHSYIKRLVTHNTHRPKAKGIQVFALFWYILHDRVRRAVAKRGRYRWKVRMQAGRIDSNEIRWREKIRERSPSNNKPMRTGFIKEKIIKTIRIYINPLLILASITRHNNRAGP